MRITAIIILAACLTASARGLTQTVSLSMKNASLEKVFTEIKKQTGYSIFCNYELLEKSKPVNINVKNASIDDVMKLCLKDQNLDYRISERSIVVKEKPTNPNGEGGNDNTTALPPPIDITGKVTDTDGNPLAGATVKVKGTSKGTTTNNDGVFVLKAVDENATLEISFVGYETYTIAVANKTAILASLKIKPESLNEVVINKGYYTEKQKLSTGNVTKVTSKEVEKSPVSNVLLAMQGRVPGMEIIQANGLPGSGITVRVRGRNSFENGNDPLYIIDGVPYSSQMLPGLSGPITGGSGAFGTDAGRMSGNPLSYLNPFDIESVEVLKDADATAIYGTRGANGVVLITTKKGKGGATKVDVNIQQGWGRVTKFIPWLNTRQYLDMRYEALRNDGVSQIPSNASNYDLSFWDTTRYTNWNKELIGGTANYSNMQLSIYGGSNNVQYRIGYNYNKQTTVYPKSFGDPKGSLNFNINSSSSNRKLKLQFSGNYQLDKNSLPYYDLSQYTNLAPDAPSLYNPDGSLNWQMDPNKGEPSWDNPLAWMNGKYKRHVNNLVTNAQLSYDVLSKLQFRINAGYTDIQSDEVRTQPSSMFAPVYAPFVERTSQYANTQNDSWIVEPLVNFETAFLKGKISALVGATIQQSDSKAQAITGKKFNNDLVMEDPKAASTVQIDYSLNSTYKYNAAFGRMNYNYADKYLINLTARRDGTSRFGPDKRFANFGAAGIGWVFSKEYFISRNMPILSYGKVRASYGTTGSDQVGDYRYLNLYNYVNYTLPYQGSLSLGLNGLFNPNLAWEETKKFEAGVELGFWQDRIILTASHYRNESSNQLTNYTLPSNVGAGAIPTNLEATIRNTGWEITATSNNIQSKEFHWSSSINLSAPRNKLISASPNAISVNRRLIGHSLSTKILYSYAGIDPTSGSYIFDDGMGGLTTRPDTVAINPVTLLRYSQHLFNADVKFFGGFQNSFSWKQFQLDVLFQFEKRMGETNQRGKFPGTYSSGVKNQPVSVLDRWQKPGDNALVQRYNQNGSLNNPFNSLIQSDAAWMDASYVRLKNVSVSWQMPSKIRQRLHLQNARLYTQAQNLFVITNYKGSDPETRSLTSLPPLRVWTVGCQLTF